MPVVSSVTVTMLVSHVTLVSVVQAASDVSVTWALQVSVARGYRIFSNRDNHMTLIN